MTLRRVVDGFTQEALGRSHRPDPIEPGLGGPAGNARLTAWTGLILLVLSLAELVTLLDVRGWLSWHVVIGVLLVPPALLKTATTGWRIVRFYTGNRGYRDAGPPPLLLRILGPLVVLSTLAVLGTGVALILLPPAQAREDLVAGPFGLSLLNLHKAAFVVWAAATGIHVLGRLLPALRLTVVRATARGVPGTAGRWAVLSSTVAVAVAAAILALSLAAPWHDQPVERPDRAGVHIQVP